MPAGGNNELNIQITATDDATPILEGVGETADAVGKAVADAGTQVGTTWADSIAQLQGMMADVPNLLTPMEEAVVQSAYTAMEAWTGTGDAIDASVATAADAADVAFSSVADAAKQAALSTVQSWDSSLAELQTMMAQTDAEMTASMGGMGGKAASGMGGIFGYFRYYMLGSMAERAGKSLLGIDTSAISAAAAGGSGLKIQKITDQIAKLHASMATQSASLEHSTGTTDQMIAKHQMVAASIAAERTQIELLQRQLAPLEAEYKVSGVAATQYAAAGLKLTTDWQHFLATVGLPLMENMTKTLILIDDIVQKLTVWAEKNPKLASEILKTIGVLGIFLTVLGGILLTIAPMILMLSLFGIALSAPVIAGTLLVTGLIIAFTFFEVWFTDHVGKWSEVLQSWGHNLRTVIQSALNWIGSVWNSSWKNVSDFFTNIWNGIYNTIAAIINKIKALISGVVQPIQSIVGAIGSVWGGIAGMVGGAAHALGVASGGSASSPMLALAGAGSQTVVPSSSFSGTPGGAGTGYGSGSNVVNITGTFLSKDAARKLSQMMIDSLNQKLRLTY